jgi:hypothetical protein
MAPPLPEGAERASRKRITDRVYMMSWMSIIPALVAYRQSIECVAVGLPLRHELIHQRHKALVVRGFEQVKHLVNQNVFEAFLRLSGEIGIQSDRTRAVIATPPLGLHPLDENPSQL